MSINTDSCSKVVGRRQSFSVREYNDSVLLRIVHSPVRSHNQTIRFLHVTFNETAELFAAANHIGNIYVFSLALKKYWLLMHENCSLVKFFSKDSTDSLLLVASTSGDVHIIYPFTADVESDLHGHKTAVVDVSFSENHLCVTLSHTEAIVWCLESFTKKRMLSTDNEEFLKFVMFTPVTNHLLGCFQDESIQIWDCQTYDALAQIIPKTFTGPFKKIRIRSIAFTSNGMWMVVVGHSSNMFLFKMDTFALRTMLPVSDLQGIIKKAQFVNNAFDNGVNKILLLLTNAGCLYFYDMEFAQVISRIVGEQEIWKFSLDFQNNVFGTIHKNGQIIIHNLSFYLQKKTVTADENKTLTNVKPVKAKKGKLTRKNGAARKIAEILELGKLKRILREFGEYPALYRKIIWSNILRLPNNETLYDSITKNALENDFDLIEDQYPLAVKPDIKNLKRLLSDLVSWTPFLACVDYLPTLVFPFVKCLRNNPILCFEMVVFIIMNYCQYWFEYQPMPPLNVLGLIENLLIINDLDLMEHLNSFEVSAQIYAWHILRSMFSEVLQSKEWVIFCDHLVSNEPAFLIIAVATYSLVNRERIMAIRDAEEFEIFYRSYHAFDFKRFIKRCYKLLDDTPGERHPRTFLDEICYIPETKYPILTQYPKNCLEVWQNMKQLREESNALLIEEHTLRQQSLEPICQYARFAKEQERCFGLDRYYSASIAAEEKNIRKQRERVKSLTTTLQPNDDDVTTMSSEIYTQNHKGDHMLKQLSALQDPKREEEELLKQYANLLKRKIKIEGLVENDDTLNLVQLQDEYKDIYKSQTVVPYKDYLRQLNVSTGIGAVNSLIKKIEGNFTERKSSMNKPQYYSMIKSLTSECEDLSGEVTKLIGMLGK